MKSGKWVVLIASLCALILFCVYQIGFVDELSTDIPVISEEKLYKLEQNCKNLSGDEQTEVTLSFAEEELPFQRDNLTFYLPLSMDTESYENGSFQATLNGEVAKVYFSEDFTKKEKRSLMKEDTKIPCVIVGENSFYLCYLTLTGTSLIRFESTEYVTEEQLPLFEMKVYDSSTKKDWVTTCYTTSTLRGNTSLSYDKKSLRLNLKKQNEDGAFIADKKNLLGLRDDDDWILNSLYADDAKIKDKLANELWNEAGGRSNPYGKIFGTQLEYVEVFMNDGYMGLYGLMYPIDAKQVGTNKVSEQLAAGESVVERLYKKKYTGQWNKDDFVGVLPDPAMPDYRGGFYVKGDTILQNEEEWQPLYELAACIQSEDTIFQEQITEIANQQNILENWLFYQAIGGFDNYAKNYYYLVRNNGGKAYGYFIPWDLNIAFGDVYADNQYYASYDETVVHDVIPWEPANRMLELDVKNSRQMVKDTWKTWRETVFDTENVISRMEELYQELLDSGAYEREKKRWPNGRYTDDLTDMKRFTKERLSYVDEYVDGL